MSDDRDDVTSRDDGGTLATRREGQGRRERPQDHLGPGTKIGRYIVIDILGAGGMGVVYAAHDPELDRKVAIKLLQAQPGGSESGGQSWLVREAQAMARLAHPNVVAVYDVGAMSAEHVFVAMELVAGVTLRKWLKQPRTWREIVPVMRDAALGLAAAHAAGLVHRDFKPDNVLVGDDGRVRVMDFGLARLGGVADLVHTDVETRSPLSERLTMTGAVLGTPAYMAPEIYASQGASAETDQFAFGVALYEALFRTRPYDRDKLVDKTATLPVPPPSKVPAWLTRVVLRAIALEPAQRYPSMTALIAALDAEPRRWIGIGALAAVAVGVTAALVVSTRETAAPDARCGDAPAQLARVWNPATRDALAAAFRAPNKPYLASSIAGVEKALDTYGTAWVAMHTDACRATRISGAQTEAVMTVRMQCLDERLVEFSTLVTLFGRADEATARTAIAATQKLSPLADCANTAALLAPEPLPTDPAARAEVVRLGAKLAEARALYRASRPKDTLALTTEIAAAVERTQHQPTLATLHFLRGQALWVIEGAAQGEPELQKAAFAAEAGKADETRVETWLQLTNLAISANRFDVAAERLHQAQAAIARLGTKWDLKVRVMVSEALLYSGQSKFDQAIPLAREARALAEKSTELPSQIYATLAEATILNSAAYSAEALAAFEKVLAYHETFGHDRIEVATTLANMASAELLVGKHDAAIAHITDAIAIEEKIYGPASAEVARKIGTLGAAQAAKGDLPAAIATTQRALKQLAATVGEQDESYAVTLGQLAENLIASGDHVAALPYIERGIALQTARLGPAHIQTLAIVLNKCDALSASGKHAAAIATCSDAVATAEKAFGRTAPLLFLFYAHTGLAQRAAKRDADAAASYARAIAVGSADPGNLAYLQFLEAQARWDLRQRPRAIALATAARDGYVRAERKEQADEVTAWLARHRR